MARLKIGDGIQFEAQLPKVEQSESSGLDVMALVEKAIAMLPKPAEIEPQKEADLTYIEDNISSLRDYVEGVEDRLNKISTDMDFLHVKIEDGNNKIVAPEVKQITYFTDISPEILKQCQEMIKHSEVNIILKINDIQRKNKKHIAYFVGGVIILTIFYILKGAV